MTLEGVFSALPKSLRLASLAGAAFLLGAPLTAGAARADFRVCNGTQSLVGVAIAYRAEAGWTTEGWWRIPATTCKSIIEGPLSSRYYYLYAEDADGRSRWAGPINLCIAENEFKITGRKDCLKRGYQRMGFREYDTGEQASWMVQLTEAPRSESGKQ
ncbi:DUF1036 domain-containing protein [Jiella sonneratiae]|uniref:DUF1036 domain-containing protein n=1 Tax=Jiella sonneratiae TaxID=2816856 RepID=A0ABS3IZ64_9HYPH|nr:DUF1036 domain-containing protein [Jiella sonneratiae]MBO0902706.1 DUF1036 domain-containing protein [Jiella sonneratiae]